MHNPRLATRYAKSLLDLAVERNSVDAVLSDMQLLNEICAQSRDFEVMLRSPVIHGDKKINVINEILKGRNVNELSYAFIKLLATKGREANLPEIAEAFITQYNTLRNIRIVKLTTATPVAESLKASIQAKVATYMPKDTINMKTGVDESLIGGFVLEVDDQLFDASVKKSLNEIRSKIIDHTYESRLH
ncbi:MAG: synthase delta chain [Flavipsychrobacter sp.]|jgi:F-type H+-transporting ATPase subunit delta|nr:synthase delta chain [Flavipsychrobacter sp.]